ncbi:MAG: sigma-70 family RNA polymerase sigma factor [Actinomycetales bacterium]
MARTERGGSRGSPPGGALRPDLEDVFRACYGRVVAVAARVLGSTAAAEDVAQECFLSFARSQVPAPEAANWLVVAAAHTALNHARTARRRSLRELNAASPALPEDTPDVADTVLAAEERAQVRAALARLPRPQALVLVLRHSGLSYGEVARALDLSPPSVGTTLRRAEAALRKELTHDASSD